MADVFSREKRSDVMSKIRSRDNEGTELALMRLFRANRVRGWKRHQPLLGKPDFTFTQQRVAVFVDGCFWHGCPKCYRKPKSNKPYWTQKLKGNIERDKRVKQKLRRLGWRVLRIWECSLEKRPSSCLRKIQKALSV